MEESMVRMPSWRSRRKEVSRSENGSETGKRRKGVDRKGWEERGKERERKKTHRNAVKDVCNRRTVRIVTVCLLAVSCSVNSTLSDVSKRRSKRERKQATHRQVLHPNPLLLTFLHQPLPSHRYSNPNRIPQTDFISAHLNQFPRDLRRFLRINGAFEWTTEDDADVCSNLEPVLLRAGKDWLESLERRSDGHIQVGFGEPFGGGNEDGDFVCQRRVGGMCGGVRGLEGEEGGESSSVGDEDG
jgi:hypothetical protein